MQGKAAGWAGKELSALGESPCQTAWTGRLFWWARPCSLVECLLWLTEVARSAIFHLRHTGRCFREICRAHIHPSFTGCTIHGEFCTSSQDAGDNRAKCTVDDDDKPHDLGGGRPSGSVARPVLPRRPCFCSEEALGGGFASGRYVRRRPSHPPASVSLRRRMWRRRR